MTAPHARTARAIVIALAALLPSAAPAQEEAPARKALALTVYSNADPASFDPKQYARDSLNNDRAGLPGFGVVRETRKVKLEKGRNVVRFTDVAAGIDPTTVSFASKTAPDTTSVIEQDYEYDLVGADKILQKYLGRGVTVQQKGQPPVEADLLSAGSDMLVLQENKGDRGLRLVPRGQDLVEIALPKLPAGLITKPTLVWTVETDTAGEHDVLVSYQTDGMTWRADYNLVVSGDEKKADLGAWVTLLNQSGATYPEASLKLVAGDVQRVEPPYTKHRGAVLAAAPMAAPAPQFEEKAFFEYHLYTLGRPTSLAERSTKQIELFPAKTGVSVEKTYAYYGMDLGFRPYGPGGPNIDRNLGSQGNTKVDVYLSFKNDEASGLGLPLPAGRVRVYKKDDADAALEFVGEDTIKHTPKGEEILIKLGSAFDVVGERKPLSFEANTAAHTVTETVQITLRNHKKEPVRVVIKENLFRWSTWSITRTSDRFEKHDARTVHFPVDVKPDGEKVVTYTVRYTW
jgi:hypothetical protein